MLAADYMNARPRRVIVQITDATGLVLYTEAVYMDSVVSFRYPYRVARTIRNWRGKKVPIIVEAGSAEFRVSLTEEWRY